MLNDMEDDGDQDGRRDTAMQGLTLVHYSAHLEPFLTQKHTLNTLDTPYHPKTTPKQTLTAPPVTQKVLMLSSRVDECKPLPP